MSDQRNNNKQHVLPEDKSALGFDQSDLIKLARWQMPFGKYQGRALIDLPEEYLFWFRKHDFPNGELGRLMRLCLELKIEGLEGLIRPLKRDGDPLR